MDRVIASGGSTKATLWLRIKASIYGVPIVLPAEAECSLIGCAAMAQTAAGRYGGLTDAAAALVRYAAEIVPDPFRSDTYARIRPAFGRLYRHSPDLYGDLDAQVI